jgi:hypothetical protein
MLEMNSGQLSITVKDSRFSLCCNFYRARTKPGKVRSYKSIRVLEEWKRQCHTASLNIDERITVLESLLEMEDYLVSLLMYIKLTGCSATQIKPDQS